MKYDGVILKKFAEMDDEITRLKALGERIMSLEDRPPAYLAA
jgi:hypothetical protein